MTAEMRRERVRLRGRGQGWPCGEDARVRAAWAGGSAPRRFRAAARCGASPSWRSQDGCAPSPNTLGGLAPPTGDARAPPRGSGCTMRVPPRAARTALSFDRCADKTRAVCHCFLPWECGLGLLGEALEQQSRSSGATTHAPALL